MAAVGVEDGAQFLVVSHLAFDERVRARGAWAALYFRIGQTLSRHVTGDIEQWEDG